MTTLLCIPLVLLLGRRLPFPLTVAGLLFFWNVAAAAIEIPAVDERKEKKPRRKLEENSLTEAVLLFYVFYVNRILSEGKLGNANCLIYSL
jgi:hypothetical protein